jgi:hypothetical protein
MAVSDDELQKAKEILGAALDARLAAYLDQIGEKVFRAVPDVLRANEFRLSSGNISKAIWDERSVEYENQKDADGNPLPVDSGKGARDTMARSFQATNGQVYRNSATLASIVARLDAQDKLLAAIAAKVGVTPGN